VIFGLRTFEQVEFHKPRHRVEVAITRQPYVFESLLRPFDDTESVHGDKHRGISWSRAKLSILERIEHVRARHQHAEGAQDVLDLHGAGMMYEHVRQAAIGLWRLIDIAA
jgi:hypothetical protein